MSLRITARPARGIWRCGVFHPPEPVLFGDSYFDDDQIEILRKDRDLVVEEFEDDGRAPLDLIDGNLGADLPRGGVDIASVFNVHVNTPGGGAPSNPISVDAGAPEKSGETQSDGAPHTSQSADPHSVGSSDGVARADVDGSRSESALNDVNGKDRGAFAANVEGSERSPASSAPDSPIDVGNTSGKSGSAGPATPDVDGSSSTRGRGRKRGR